MITPQDVTLIVLKRKASAAISDTQVSLDSEVLESLEFSSTYTEFIAAIDLLLHDKDLHLVLTGLKGDAQRGLAEIEREHFTVRSVVRVG